MKFRSPTDTPIRVALTSGHVKLIGPELIELEPRFVKDAVAAGAIPEGVPQSLMETQESPSDQLSRNEQIKKTLLEMLDSSEPDEFTGNGLPSVPAVSKRVGYKVAREEVYPIWDTVAPQPGSHN